MKKGILYYFLLTIPYSLYCRDLPVFYRAPLFPGTAKHSVRDWATSLEIGFHRASTRKSWDEAGNKHHLLSIFGPLDVIPLGLHLNSVFAQTPSVTKHYWEDGGKLNPAPDNTIERINNNGLFDIKGKLSTKQISIILEQQLFSGFFIQAFIPYRSIYLRDIAFCNRGEHIFSIHKDAQLPLDPNADNVFSTDTFFMTDFPTILRENGFCLPPSSGLCTQYRKSGISDIYLSAGWAYVSKENPITLSLVRFTVQAGAIVPVGGDKAKEDALISLPLGYNDHWGVKGQAMIECGVFEKIILGLHGNSTIFFTDTRCIRMISEKHQQGWFRLGKGRANVDPSILWQACLYAKGERLYNCLTVLAGYSLTHHEGTLLRSKDSSFLSKFIEHELLDNNRIICANPIINNDKHYKAWEYHTLHIKIEVNTQSICKKWFSPTIVGEISYPLFGKQVFAAEMYGGLLSLQATWNF